MSTPRELRERFKKEPGGGKAPPAPEVRSDVSEILGLTAQDLMKQSIISDIQAMIDKGYRTALEGYVLCLSRIIDHNNAWEYITEAFRSKNETVPRKYYKQFGQKETPPAKRKTVK